MMRAATMRAARPLDGTVARIGAMVAAVLAAGLLLVRPAVTASTSRPLPVLVLIYAAVLAASIAPRVRRGERLVAPWAVAGIGIGAMVVTFAARIGGVAPPLSASATSLTLMVLAAVSEEALFRRLLYGCVEALGAPAAIAATAAAFALLHLPLYGVASLPLDLGAGALLSWQRWASGSWTAPGITHVAANVLATLR